MILSFGEILLRLSPALGGKWINENSIPTFVGGAELNVATALANWGLNAGYASALPKNSLSEDIKAYLSGLRISHEKMQMCGERIGLYYLPQGQDMKNAGVIYDRANSSFSGLQKGDIDWGSFFEGVKWLHLSAISPAVSQQVAELCIEMAKEAADRKIFISFDLNYRSKLWKYGKNPVEIVPEIVKYCDVLMGNIWATNNLLGISIEKDVAINKVDKSGYLEEAKASSRALRMLFPKLKTIANTFRFDAGESGINYYATLYTDTDFFVSKEFSLESVVDKVGSGDCFMAGIIYGINSGLEPQKIIDFAASAAVGKLQEFGDASKQTVAEILNRI